MGHFAPGFALSRNRAETAGFSEGAVCDRDFGVCRQHVVILFDDRCHQAAAGDLEAGPCGRRLRNATPIVGHASAADGLGDDTLAHIFMDRVIGDKANRRRRLTIRACLIENGLALRVEVLVVIDNTGKKGGSGDSALGLRDASIGHGSAVGCLHRLGAPNCFVKRNWCRGRWRAGLGLRRRAAVTNNEG